MPTRATVHRKRTPINTLVENVAVLGVRQEDRSSGVALRTLRWFCCDVLGGEEEGEAEGEEELGVKEHFVLGAC